ncbi:hypothetical protein COSO111634_37725 [Corallococcus soli]
MAEVTWTSGVTPASRTVRSRYSRTSRCACEPTGCGTAAMCSRCARARPAENTSTGAEAGRAAGAEAKCRANATVSPTRATADREARRVFKGPRPYRVPLPSAAWWEGADPTVDPRRVPVSGRVLHVRR